MELPSAIEKKNKVNVFFLKKKLFCKEKNFKNFFIGHSKEK